MRHAVSSYEYLSSLQAFDVFSELPAYVPRTRAGQAQICSSPGLSSKDFNSSPLIRGLMLFDKTANDLYLSPPPPPTTFVFFLHRDVARERTANTSTHLLI